MSAPRPLAELAAQRLVPWRDLDWPVDWAARFGRVAPIVLEIGFGNGDFLVHAAAADLGRNYVGIEIAWGSVQRLLRRVDRSGIGNVLALEGDAAFLVEHVFPPGTIDEAVINFSDPWRKERHHDRRLVRAEFLDVLGGRMREGAALTVATDHPEYAEWIAAEFAAQSAFAPATAGGRLHEMPGRRPTRYEEKARAAGRLIHYFVWRRKPAPPPAPRPETLEPMPNVLVESLTVDAAHVLAEPRLHRETRGGLDVIVKLLGAYRAAERQRTWVEALVQEGSFRQHFVVEIERRAGGITVIQPAALGSPRPTYGVKRAVRAVVDALLAADPGARVRSSTIGPTGED